MNQPQHTTPNNTPLDSLLTLEPKAVNVDKIMQLTRQKLAQKEGTSSSIPATAAATRRTSPRRRFAFYAVAAVLATLLVGGTAYAIGSFLVGQNPIDFNYQFNSDEGALASTQGGIPVKGQELENREKYNVAVGQTVQLDGVAVTLDTIALDDNFIDVFLTYTYDEPIDLKAVVDSRYADFNAINLFTSQPTVVINGYAIGGPQREAKDATAYFASDEQRVIKKVVDYLIPITMPNVIDIEVILDPFTDNHTYVSAIPQQVVFTVQVDKSAAALQTQAVAPGQYEFVIDGQTRILDLEKLAVTPFGAVVSVNTHGDVLSDGGTYLDIRDFLIIDDQGNEYRLFTPQSALQGELHAGELRDVPASVQSFTITPLSKADENGPRDYRLNDSGVQIPTSPEGGFYLRDYQVNGNILTIMAEPYGNELTLVQGANYLREFIVDNGFLAQQYPGAMMSGSYDKGTNLYTSRHEYHTAPEEEIRKITHFHVYYDEGEPAYNQAAALTLPLA